MLYIYIYAQMLHIYIYINVYIYIYIYVIYICNRENNVPSPGYHHNGFVATHAIGHMMCSLYVIIIRYALSLKCSILVVNNRTIYTRMIKK